MNGEPFDLADDGRQSAAGHSAVVSALVIALHENGVLHQDSYCRVLRRLWLQMPEEQAIGESGAVIENVLDLLAARALPAPPSANPEKRPEAPRLAGKPVSDGTVRRTAATPSGFKPFVVS